MQDTYAFVTEVSILKEDLMMMMMMMMLMMMMMMKSTRESDIDILFWSSAPGLNRTTIN